VDLYIWRGDILDERTKDDEERNYLLSLSLSLMMVLIVWKIVANGDGNMTYNLLLLPFRRIESESGKSHSHSPKSLML